MVLKDICPSDCKYGINAKIIKGDKMEKFEFILRINDVNCGTFIHEGLNESDAFRCAEGEIQAAFERLPVDIEWSIEVA